MNNVIETLRRKVQSGEIRANAHTQGNKKVGEGVFTCLVTEAAYGVGESGNRRGTIKLKVIKGGEEAIGGTFNVYEQTLNDKFMENSIAIWSDIFKGCGLGTERFFDDAEDYADVISNIMSLVNRLTKKNFKLVVKRKAQAKLDTNGRVSYYNDIDVTETIKANDPNTIESSVSPTPEVDLGSEDLPDLNEGKSARKKAW